MRIGFFAAKSDLIAVLDDFETRRAIKYVLMSSSGGPKTEEWTRGADIPSLGYADGSQTYACKSFLITDTHTHVNPQRITHYDGSHRFDVDQLINPDSITFIPGGEWKDLMMIAGLFGTASNSEISRSLMGLARRAIRKHFTKVQAFWVGPEALTYLRRGKRLTTAEQSPPIYDLRE